ncbi:MAG TPA: Crp/Fnr family transcriptional regulator [Phototrophicaceae bacterium]|nr:Crp/Fnr family transcriptional regulator [Phototrophicaceae bacterium]
MSKNTFQNIPVGNKMLAALPAKEYQRLADKLESFDLKFGDTIYQPNENIEYIYFPNSGIISFMTEIEKRSTLEVGLVGNEGMAGLSTFLGTTKSPNSAIVRAAGVAWKMRAADFLKACKENSSMLRVVHRYTHLLLTQLSLVGACNRFHPIVKRLGCWLLMTSDRLGTEKFHVTQQFISDMLGVRREAVALAASSLQEKQLISYSRGNLSILNRMGLEEFICKCYSILKEEEQNYLN